MHQILEKTAESLAGVLEPGESVVAASKAQLGGNTERTSLKWGLGGAVGGLAITAFEGHQARREDGGIDLPAVLRHGTVLAVTQRRLLVLSCDARGNPDSAVLAIDRDRITRVEQGTTRVMFIVSMKTLTLHVEGGGPDDGLTFEFPKMANEDAATVIAALS